MTRNSHHELNAQVAESVADAVRTVREAPAKTADSITSSIKGKLDTLQANAQAQLDAAKREMDQLSR